MIVDMARDGGIYVREEVVEPCRFPNASFPNEKKGDNAPFSLGLALKKLHVPSKCVTISAEIQDAIGAEP